MNRYDRLAGWPAPIVGLVGYQCVMPTGWPGPEAGQAHRLAGSQRLAGLARSQLTRPTGWPDPKTPVDFYL